MIIFQGCLLFLMRFLKLLDLALQIVVRLDRYL